MTPPTQPIEVCGGFLAMALSSSAVLSAVKTAIPNGSF
jgi:hypothetical protein